MGRYRPKKKRVEKVSRARAEAMTLAVAQRVIQATLLAGVEVLRVEYGYTDRQIQEWTILTSQRAERILGATAE